MSAGERCLAAHVEDVTPCGGPVRAVRIVDRAGAEVTGCVRHGAVLLASLEGGRVYPGPQAREGDAIEVFERAQTLSPFSFEVADDKLSTPVPASEGSQVSGEEVGPADERPNLAATGAGAAAVPPVPVVAQPEPDDKQFVLFDHHLDMDVWYRDDAVATEARASSGSHDDERWFKVGDYDGDPLCWENVLGANPDVVPVLLVRGPLVDHNPETPKAAELPLSPDEAAAEVTQHPLGCSCTSCADIRRSVAS